MIPSNLQSDLKERIEAIFSDYEIKNPDINSDQEYTGLNVYEQHLPQLDGDAGEISLYPYIIIKLADGEMNDETSPHRVKVLFIVGVFDDDLDNHGYQDVSAVIQKLTEELQKQPVVNEKFILSYPMRWTIYEEDVYPFFFGGVETYWETNGVHREDIGGILHGN